MPAERDGVDCAVNVHDVPRPRPDQGVAVKDVALFLESPVDHAADGHEEVRGCAVVDEAQQGAEVAALDVHALPSPKLAQKRELHLVTPKLVFMSAKADLSA